MPMAYNHRLLKAEFHCHTYRSSDCLMKPWDLVALCKERGIDCLVVTDHNTIRGALEVKEIAPFAVVIGEEILSTEGEIIGLFLTEEVPRGLSPRDTVRRIRAQGGLVYLPHPFDRLRRSCLSERGRKEIEDEIDIVEVLNARITFPQDVERAARFALKLGAAMANGSDAHIPWEVGRAYVEMPAFTGRDDFLHALQQGYLKGRLSPPWVHLASTTSKWLKRFNMRR